MRVAIIAPPWVAVPPPAYGGTEAVLHSLAAGLAEAGHDVLLHATGGSRCPVERGRRRGRGRGEAGAARRSHMPAEPIRWREPFGMVMIEALACGTPVIATPCGAAPEIVDDGVTGYLRSCQTGLVEALASVPALDRDACRRAAKERFSAARMVDDHVAVYERSLRC